ncbi:restriction endonuclease subunit S [Flavobacterium sp. J372]|uniref:restriction endonuclease subunit S n=1 Tax=Flavobacterium sp. J372 TaxID=2898436 RepID=UPI002151EE20|nr:restriction endonuclease subunit S [Flavobacterium sp. J372]MCR5862685.1 restriction endonuclease subunit S [Flavobacterium sp. J372]
MRFPGFEGEWEVKKLVDVAKIIGGGTPDTNIEEYWNGNIQWFTPSEIKSSFVTKSNRTITELGLKRSSAKLLPKGTILLTTRATIGEVAIANEQCSTNQGFQSLIVNDTTNNIFISNWIKHNKNEFIKRANGSTFSEISRSEIEDIEVFIPSINEQEKIASLLSLIDERIQTQSKIIEQLETLIKGLSEKLFSQKLRLRGFTQEWTTKSGDEIFTNISNKNHDSDLPILAVTQEYGAIPRNLIDYNVTVTEESVSGYKVVEKGDFIISLRSFQGGIEYSEYDGICSPAYVILRPVIPVDRTFYKYYLKTGSYIINLNKRLEGIRDGKMISYKYFSEILLPFPSHKEQTAIAKFLSSIDGKRRMEKSLLDGYQSQKRYLLQNLFI